MAILKIRKGAAGTPASYIETITYTTENSFKKVIQNFADERVAAVHSVDPPKSAYFFIKLTKMILFSPDWNYYCG